MASPIWFAKYRCSRFVWYLKQLWPCLYYTQYVDKDGHHITLWRMWLGACFSICDVIVSRERIYASLSSSEPIPGPSPEEKLTEYFKESMRNVFEPVITDEFNIISDTAVELTKLVTKPEELFKEHVRHLLSQGIFPTPTRLNDAMHSSVMKPNNLNGKQSRWRREELLAAGYVKLNGRWSLP